MAHEPTKLSIRNATLPYIQSLGVIALAFVVYVTTCLVVESIFVDFVHGNPHRTQSNAVTSMLLFPLLFSMIVPIGVALVFGLSQFLQILVINASLRRFGGRGRFAVLLALPAAAMVTWYCYDYLTPTDFNIAGNWPDDWQPYQHGISSVRYLLTLAAQAAVTLFSVLFFEATLVKKLRGYLVLALLIAAIVFGGFAGHAGALGQYKLIDAR